jgi:transposase
VERQYVAIDLHARRSLIVRRSGAGEELGKVRIDNDPVALSLALAEAGPDPEVAIEACYGWYWAVDVLQAEGANVHLVHPLGMNWENRRVKNDYRDCCDLLDRLRIDRLPEAWIAPPAVRELRELVRYRAKLVALRTGLKAQVKAVLAKHGLHPPVGELWGPVGGEYLDELNLPRGYTVKLGSLRALVGRYDGEVAVLEREIQTWLADDAGYWAIQTIGGVGKTLAAVFVAEIGDIGRFGGPEQLCCWSGLTPKQRDSDVVVRRGHISKQGSTLVRWAAIEAISRVRATPKLNADYRRIAERRGVKIARVAAARKLLHLVYYGLRDGEIRCLARAEEAS